MRLWLLLIAFGLGVNSACSAGREAIEDDSDDADDSVDDTPSDDTVDVAPDVTRECDTSSECEGSFGRLDQCEIAACNVDTGRCIKLASSNGLPCIDRDFCTTEDRCIEGRCVAGPPLDCDDGNPCTLDGCDPRQGCVREIVEGRCDDGNACTVRDVCTEGRCRGERRVCDDSDPCTDDTCDALEGCAFVPLPDCR
jgi:hypothetical protein